jgi:hypothetical protein
MGGLKPIGSEKLQGMDKIRRIIEISRYNENIPQPVNENNVNTYSIRLADGNIYTISKERQGYIIKANINEGKLDYIEPITERTYHSSYSQALKRLNLMAKEMNTNYGNRFGTELFESEKKKNILNEKTILKLPEEITKKLEGGSTTPAAPAPTTPTTPAAPVLTTPTTPAAPAPAAPAPAAPAPAPLEEQGEVGVEPTPAPVDAAPAPAPAPDVPVEGGDMPAPADDEMGVEPEMEKPEKLGKEKEEVTFRLLQKLTGRLSQKIRKFNEEEEMSSEDTKYIINSILSALDLEVLEDEDLEEIVDRIEGVEEDISDIEDEDRIEDEEMSPMPPENVEPAAPTPPPTGEMAEDSIDFNRLGAKKTAYRDIRSDDDFGKIIPDDIFYDEDNIKLDGDDMEQSLKRKLRGRPSNSYYHLSHGTFGESKVDKVISKYFKIDEDEFLIKEEKKRKEIMFNKTKNSKEVDKLSENIKQKRFSLKFLDNYPTAKLIGKTKSGNLIFENKNKNYVINLNGKIL